MIQKGYIWLNMSWTNIIKFIIRYAYDFSESDIHAIHGRIHTIQGRIRPVVEGRCIVHCAVGIRFCGTLIAALYYTAGYRCMSNICT